MIGLRLIMTCRRSMIAMFSISCLTTIALYAKIDATSAIAAVAIGLAASNAGQKIGENFTKKNQTVAEPQASEASPGEESSS